MRIRRSLTLAFAAIAVASLPMLTIGCNKQDEKELPRDSSVNRPAPNADGTAKPNGVKPPPP